MPAVTSNLVWMDLEMTGLDPERDVILEMATIVTDGDLNVIAEGPALAIAQPEAKLAAMDEWNTSHHTASGLVQRVRTEGVSTIGGRSGDAGVHRDATSKRVRRRYAATRSGRTDASSCATCRRSRASCTIE